MPNTRRRATCRPRRRSASKLEELVKYTKILTDGKKKSEVGFNSTVSIKKEGSDKIHEYTIVGSEEADMRVKKLSHVSPARCRPDGEEEGRRVHLRDPLPASRRTRLRRLRDSVESPTG